jgi:hypothetical protein
MASMYVGSRVVDCWVLRWRFIYGKKAEVGGGMCDGLFIGVDEGCAIVLTCA